MGKEKKTYSQKAIEFILKEASITSYELTRRAGLSSQYLTAYKKGASSLGLKNFIRFCDAAELKPSYVLKSIGL